MMAVNKTFKVDPSMVLSIHEKKNESKVDDAFKNKRLESRKLRRKEQ